MTSLLKNGVYGMFIPKEFGGEGLCQKDLIYINEALGQDLSTFLTVYNTQLAANIILNFGSNELRQKYLSKIANFQCKPAICFQNET